MPNASIWQYTVGDTLVGRTVLKLNSGPGSLRLGGWLDSEGEARHDVLVLIPKNTTNLKCSSNSIKIRCTNVVPNASIWQYTVGPV